MNGRLRLIPIAPFHSAPLSQLDVSRRKGAGPPEEDWLTDVHGNACERGPFIDGSYLEWYLGYRAARVSAGITVAVASDVVDDTRTCV